MMVAGASGAAAVLASGQPASAAPAVAGSGATPQDYGAVGDGVADDTAAINQCLAANRAVDFGGPENTYLISDTLYVQQSVPQVLTAAGATIKAGAAVNMMRLKNARHSVRGLAFDGDNQSAGIGIIVEGTTQRCAIEGCSFLNVAACAVSVSPGAHYTRIVGCFMDHCGQAASVSQNNFRSSIYVADADSVLVLDNDVLRCNWGIIFRGETDISLYNCRGNTVSCISPAPAASQGISNGNGRSGRIENNTILAFADNSIDCHGCTNMTITGNSTSGGKDGVFVGDAPSSSITITGNVFRGPQRGVRVLTGTDGALVIGVVISANTVSNPTDGGIQVSESGTAQISGITVTDNELNIGDAGTYGIKMTNVEASRVSGNRIHRSSQHAINLTGVDIVDVSDNLIQDAGHPTPSTYDAIYVTGSNRVLARNNIVYGGARYAVNLTGGTGMTVTGTRWRSVSPGGVNNAATGTVQSDNVQF
ncbi:right-handed parallel beta-helix repeat-containing protein [Paractinoplanes globisporus]|uniref:Right-handed parallel beta-helix repeat-containing protein n=1 Tax=Paractinoplanes globisporus TaxID=113565 RepID=A0ABW6WVG1_9ACTN|nr:right-handed parallel beta-helix repeat-containing protein [Actinoplanes globisporus]